ncbi:bacterial regulatory s, luxR family protein, partial [Vibrio parahaemolyticus V-223/04]
MRAYSVT